MRVRKIGLRNIGPYRDLAELDLDAIGPGLVAISAANGQGKTTALECVPGALYSTMPSRGPAASMATARDSMIELSGEQGGHAFRVVQSFDAVSGKREALLEWDGEPVGGPKVRDFQAAVESRFPPYSVFLAACFSAQSGAGSLLRMDRASRRDLFGRLLGLERLEHLAKSARDRAASAERDLTASRAALDAIRSGAADVVALDASLLAARGDAARATAAQRDAQDRLRAVTVERDRLTATLAEAQRAERLAQDAQRRAEGAAEALARLERQEEALAPLLAEAPVIREQAADLRDMEAELVRLGARVEAADAEAKRAGEAADEASRRDDAAFREAETLRGRLVALDAVLADAPVIRETAGKIAALAADLDRLRVEGEAAAGREREAGAEATRLRAESVRAGQEYREAVRACQDATLRADDARRRLQIAMQSSGAVPCAGVLADEIRGGCPALVGHFQIRDNAQREIAEIKAGGASREAAREAAGAAAEAAIEASRVAELAAAHASGDADDLRTSYRETKAEHDRLAAGDRSGQLAGAEAEARLLREASESAEASAELLATQVREANRARAEASDLAGRLDETRRHCVLEVRDLRAKDRSAALAKAEADSAALGGRLEAARADAQARAVEAMEAGAQVPVVDLVALEDAEKAARDVGRDCDFADGSTKESEYQVAKLEAHLDAARAAQTKAAELVARVAPMERDLSDWRFLARGLGREGVQALELDAAGPRVSDLCNELLRESYGGRFAVRLDTQAALANGKGVKETFDVVVLDNERGREGNGEDLSGGEKVIVGEALGLAVGLFHAQAGGVEIGTVVRDETVGALDPENGERYLAMLRGFLRIGRVHQLLYVAHSPSLVEMADAVVRVENGRIAVSA